MIGLKIVCAALLIVALDGVTAKVFWETTDMATERKNDLTFLNTV